MSEPKETELQKWSKKIDWKLRVKAVCKPCWEIKYCPYGILVENFPLNEEFTDKSCKIYGHDCPVFLVAEPFTETKELRRISRTITRATQMRVLKRDNQICQVCNKPVSYEDIEFDHVIPWSKGGSSEESNIRLLCSSCNRKRSNNFEGEYLIDSLTDLVSEPDKDVIVDVLKEIVNFGHQFYKIENRYPNEDDFAERLNEGIKEAPEIQAADYLNDFVEFFNQNKISKQDKNAFEGLKYRWGFIDKKIHKLKFVSDKLNIKIDELLQLELELLFKMGIRLSNEKTTYEKLLKK